MPWFTLHRNYALSTTKGHSVNFKKGERTWVPKAVVAEAVAIGAVSEEPVDVLPPEAPPPVKVTEVERKAAVFAAFEKILLRSHRGDFMASGQPHPRKVEELLGFDVPQKERDALWMEYNAKKAEEAEQEK